DLRFGRQRRMATGKDQPQAIVGNFVRVVIRLGNIANETGLRIRRQLLVVTSLTPDAVDGLVLCRLDDPGAGNIGDTGTWPLIDGGRKGFLRALFGQVKVADQPD